MSADDWWNEVLDEAGKEIAAQREIECFWNACIEEFAGDPDEE